ncbi:MAG: carboxypeptidase-like regulatory domain-containing protein, partial [Betaproteobacteria bacterium]
MTVLAVAAMLAAPAFAQVQTGSILVRARDSQGGVLPGAAVTITSPVLVSPMTGTTDSGGAYRFPSLPPGTYDVKIELSGFQTIDRQGIIVSVGQTTPLDLTLGVARVSESIT